ncbi:MAG: ATP-binding protein [Candidatus Margulisiibacteriota bacterium]
MKRSLEPLLLEDLPEKIILLSGPRQSGKTTLAKSLNPLATHLNYDESDDRDVISKKTWDPQTPLIIFDELHKMQEWKRYLKGLFDTRGIPPQMLVTGSAKLDTYRKVGDSLAGRFFYFRLHPLDIQEVGNALPAQESFNLILECSGFPEPFLRGKTQYYGRWAKSHQDIILRQDMLDLERVTDIHAIELLIDLMSRRVGSTVSYANLAQDVQRDPKTVKKWFGFLENLYLTFPIRPFGTKLARAYLQQPKHYLYNTAAVKGDMGAKFENLVACALLKELHWQQDTQGRSLDLCFLRTRDGHEVDFVIVENNRPIYMIECKWTEPDLSSLNYFHNHFKKIPAVQLIGKGLPRNFYYPDTHTKVCAAPEWLLNLRQELFSK